MNYKDCECWNYDHSSNTHKERIIEMDSLVSKINKIINLHETMKGAYFFSSPTFANERRRYEEKYSLVSEFEYQGNLYRVEQVTNCSCRNVYYTIRYYENGKQIYKDIRFLKKILKECNDEKGC